MDRRAAMATAPRRVWVPLRQPALLCRPTARPRLVPLALWLGLLAAAAPLANPAAVQEAGYGQTLNSPQQQRELDYGTGPARNTVLDATNPIDLMNRLQRATAMDDATPPADAIDAALRDFQNQPVKSP